MEPELYVDPILVDTGSVASAGVLAGMGMGMILFELAIFAVIIVAWWKVFTKAGKPGWASLIPFYNTYVLIKIAGKPGWWFFLLLIPFVNFVIIFIVVHEISKAFGKGIGYTLGLFFLGIIFWPMLAFGDAQYHGGADVAPQEPTPQPTPGQTPGQTPPSA